MRPRHALWSAAVVLLGCLERPAEVECLGDIDCPGERRCRGGVCAAADDEGVDGEARVDARRADAMGGATDASVPDAMGDAASDGKLDAADAAMPDVMADVMTDVMTDVMPDATRDAMANAMPDVGVTCPPGADAGPDAGSACPSRPDLGPGCALVDDPDEGALGCAPRGAPFVVEAPDYPSPDRSKRHVALAVGGGGRVAVAWTDPPPDCGYRCVCPFDGDLDGLCPTPPDCDCDGRQGLHVACLDADLTRAGGVDDWRRAAPGVVITDASNPFEPAHPEYVDGAADTHQLGLSWIPAIERYALTWAEADWASYDPGGAPPGAGPGAIGVALLHADCTLDEVTVVPEDQRVCNQRASYRDPRVAHGPDGFRLIWGESGGGVGGDRAATLDALAFAPVEPGPCSGWPRATFAHLGEHSYLVYALDLAARGEIALLVRRVAVEAGRVEDHTDPRPGALGGALTAFDRERGHRLGGFDVAPGGAGHLAVAWRLDAECGRAGEADAPVWFQQIDPEAALSGESACRALDGFGGVVRGSAVQLASSANGRSPPSVARDDRCGGWYVSRRRPDGVYLSRIAPGLRRDGMYRVGPGGRSRVVVADGEPIVARVDGDGTLTVERLRCAP